MNPEDINSADGDPGAGSGEGEDLGTPSGLPEEAPPSADEEANEAVSGGGMVKPTDEGPGLTPPPSAAGEPKDTVDKK